jgi:hypothetical protein
MQWTTIVLGILALALAGLSAWYQRQSNTLQRRLVALQTTVDEIKRFDEATARNFLAQARMLDHETWSVQEMFKAYMRQVRPPDSAAERLGIDLATAVGGTHKMGLSNFRMMVRVYQLSGHPITGDLVDRWIREEFIPEHYRPFMLSQVK